MTIRISDKEAGNFNRNDMVRKVSLLFVNCLFVTAFMTAEEVRAQNLPKVAVYNLTDSANSGMAVQLREQIRVALVNTKKFSIYSRDFSSAEEEAQLRRNRRVTNNGANSTVQFDAVDYAVEGSVTAAEVHTEVTPPGTFLGIQYSECRTETASIVVNITIRDSVGQILDATPIVKKYEKRCEPFNRSILLSDLARELVFNFSTRIFPMKVVAVQQDGSIVLNYGSSFLQIGKYLKINGPTSEGGFGFGNSLGRARVVDVNPEAALARMEGRKPPAIPIGSIAKIDENQRR